jgi:hypothetical protein
VCVTGVVAISGKMTEHNMVYVATGCSLTATRHLPSHFTFVFKPANSVIAPQSNKSTGIKNYQIQLV